MCQLPHCRPLRNLRWMLCALCMLRTLCSLWMSPVPNFERTPKRIPTRPSPSGAISQPVVSLMRRAFAHLFLHLWQPLDQRVEHVSARFTCAAGVHRTFAGAHAEGKAARSGEDRGELALSAAVCGSLLLAYGGSSVSHLMTFAEMRFATCQEAN